MSRKEHWEKIYSTKDPHEVSWTQSKPEISLELIAKFNLPKSASIIDIGGGDSKLVDFLIDEGYTNISVLDISAAAIERAKKRLGNKADQIKWIVADIVEFKPNEMYDLWHDRAVFHFLTKEDEIKTYRNTLEHHASNVVLGTFSVDGPFKCSGLEITQYSQEKFENAFSSSFKIIECVNHNHMTPFETIQKFVFARLAAH
jgi:trans-aconitate methyltransferase